jgi:hypothetical protein
MPLPSDEKLMQLANGLLQQFEALVQVWCRLVLHKSAIYQIPRSLLTFPQLRAER